MNTRMPYSSKPNPVPREDVDDIEEDDDDDLLLYDSDTRIWGRLSTVLVVAGMVFFALHYLQYFTAAQSFVVYSPDSRYRAEGYVYRVSPSAWFRTDDEPYNPGYYRLYNQNDVILSEVYVNNAELRPRFQDNNAIFVTPDGYLSVPLRRR